MKTVLFEDVYKCKDRLEGEKLLDDPTAETELIRHLQDRYGQIEDFFFVNYMKQPMLNNMFTSSIMPEDGDAIQKDLLEDF